ncbi:EamA family transporter [Streptomyces sp. NPDC018031]|uniref:EamA family transporter n=1 Tax=Streptomyces sp. NPDC018031 TaxID=3365033 RepID=UPI00379ABE52
MAMGGQLAGSAGTGGFPGVGADGAIGVPGAGPGGLGAIGEGGAAGGAGTAGGSGAGGPGTGGAARGRGHRSAGTGAGVGLVLASVCSLQFGAALAATLFPRLGPLGVVTCRLVGAAVVLGLLGRPWAHRRGRGARAWRVPVVFGALTACMNVCLYLALDRLPLGVVITLEFLGPLGLALALSRRWADAAWSLCAAAGVVLLGDSVGRFDAVGVGCALTAAACWAGYIVLTRRMGAAGAAGMADLALASGVALVLVAPLGVAQAGGALLDPGALALGALVGVLSSALPYTLDLLALRRLPPRIFSVLMSLDPAVAALAGWLILDQGLTARQGTAIGLVVVAGIGVTAGARAARTGARRKRQRWRERWRWRAGGSDPDGAGRGAGRK